MQNFHNPSLLDLDWLKKHIDSLRFKRSFFNTIMLLVMINSLVVLWIGLYVKNIELLKIGVIIMVIVTTMLIITFRLHKMYSNLIEHYVTMYIREKSRREYKSDNN